MEMKNPFGKSAQMDAVSPKLIAEWALDREMAF